MENIGFEKGKDDNKCRFFDNRYPIGDILTRDPHYPHE